MSVFVDACVKFCKEKAAGTVASHAWPFLLRRIWLEALSCRRRMPEKRNTSIGTTDVDNFFYDNIGEPYRGRVVSLAFSLT
ncbi:hypothetical protein GNZ12_19560 [Paraburkholderia sp. 1N]|uniref:Uncharacterized protein n=1 Tax=Paraburkholderia solitsugae TaxID=2675748 RepID=A0ABX2BRE2_9BURK|nr:hypothetical protein [Paraburkholderia solitsugae]NPT43464.1 hypothetical protein [Paraburkholderia solitsugae]